MYSSAQRTQKKRLGNHSVVVDVATYIVGLGFSGCFIMINIIFVIIVIVVVVVFERSIIFRALQKLQLKVSLSFLNLVRNSHVIVHR